MPYSVLRVFYLHAQTAADAVTYTHLMNRGYFDNKKKPEDPKIEPHARKKMVQVLGSLVYICGVH